MQADTPRRCNTFSAYVLDFVFPTPEQVDNVGSVTSLIRQRGISSLAVSLVAYLLLVQAMLDLDRLSEAARLVQAISDYGDMHIKVTFRVVKGKAVITRNGSFCAALLPAAQALESRARTTACSDILLDLPLRLHTSSEWIAPFVTTQNEHILVREVQVQERLCCLPSTNQQ